MKNFEIYVIFIQFAINQMLMALKIKHKDNRTNDNYFVNDW